LAPACRALPKALAALKEAGIADKGIETSQNRSGRADERRMTGHRAKVGAQVWYYGANATKN
jgi:hypothetical protein